MSALIQTTHRTHLVALLLSLFALLGCGPVRLVSPYDQLLDEGISAFHTDVSAFVGKMVTLAGKPEGTYEANKATYPELTARVSTLRLRAAGTPKNELT